MRSRYAVWLAAAFALSACDGGGDGGNPLLNRGARPENGSYTLTLLENAPLGSPEGRTLSEHVRHMLVSHCPAGTTSTRMKLTGGTARVTGERIRVILDQEETCRGAGPVSSTDRTPTVIDGTIGPLVIRNWDDVDSDEPDDWDEGRMFSVMAADGTEIFRGGTLRSLLELSWASENWAEPDWHISNLKFQHD